MAQIAEITDRTALRTEAEAVLRRLAGEKARLREDQWTAIEALVADRRRCLVVQRTGWGKSAVYFVATALLRSRGAGPTVIVSPLLALMRNQVEAADRAGIRARTINSANLHEWQEIESQIAEGSVDVLLISPERLNNPSFRDEVLPRLAASVGLLVVDEAHSISDWSDGTHVNCRDFRSFALQRRFRLTRYQKLIVAILRACTSRMTVCSGSQAPPRSVADGELASQPPNAALDLDLSWLAEPCHHSTAFSACQRGTRSCSSC